MIAPLKLVDLVVDNVVDFWVHTSGQSFLACELIESCNQKGYVVSKHAASYTKQSKMS